MPTRTIAHALARWTDPDGTPRLATHGQTVDLDEDTAAELDAIGATETATDVVMPSVAAEGSREDKRTRIAEALKSEPHLSNRRHAEEIGVDHKTVGSIRKALEEAGEIPHASAVAPMPAAQQARRPRMTATTEKWVAYAKDRGIEPTDAEGYTKDQLIAAVNQLDEEEQHHG